MQSIESRLLAVERAHLFILDVLERLEGAIDKLQPKEVAIPEFMFWMQRVGSYGRLHLVHGSTYKSICGYKFRVRAPNGIQEEWSTSFVGDAIKCNACRRIIATRVEVLSVQEAV